MGKETIKKKVRTFAEKISQDVPIDKMYLFGSYAKGTAGKDSDVDLLIISKRFRGKRRLQRAPLLHLQWPYNYPVDFICLTPEEFQKKKKQIGIVQEAVREGIRII